MKQNIREYLPAILNVATGVGVVLLSFLSLWLEQLRVPLSIGIAKPVGLLITYTGILQYGKSTIASFGRQRAPLLFNLAEEVVPVMAQLIASATLFEAAVQPGPFLPVRLQSCSSPPTGCRPSRVRSRPPRRVAPPLHPGGSGPGARHKPAMPGSPAISCSRGAR